jgi:hypothetical protein
MRQYLLKSLFANSVFSEIEDEFRGIDAIKG